MLFRPELVIDVIREAAKRRRNHLPHQASLPDQDWWASRRLAHQQQGGGQEAEDNR